MAIKADGHVARKSCLVSTTLRLIQKVGMLLEGGRARVPWDAPRLLHNTPQNSGLHFTTSLAHRNG